MSVRRRLSTVAIAAILVAVLALSGCTAEDKALAADFFAEFFELTLGQQVKAGLGLRTGNDDVDAVIGAKEAIQDIEAADEHESASDSHESRGEYREAREEIDKAIERRPEDPSYYATRAGLAADVGDIDGAEADVERALQQAELWGDRGKYLVINDLTLQLWESYRHLRTSEDISEEQRRVLLMLEDLYAQGVPLARIGEESGWFYESSGWTQWWAQRAAEAHNGAYGLEVEDPGYRGPEYYQ
jgi:tetratricopeptide (TPR) repeat protein